MDEPNYTHMIERLKQYLTLQFDYSKLTVAEKLSILLSRLLLVLVVALISMIALFFIASSIVEWFSGILSPAQANLTVAGILAVALLLVVAYRKPLFVTPVTRFVAKLFFAPDGTDSDMPTAQTPKQQ